MLTKQTIRYIGLSSKAVEMANKMNISDRTLINHFKSTKTEKWKMSTEEWIKTQFNKKGRK